MGRKSRGRRPEVALPPLCEHRPSLESRHGYKARCPECGSFWDLESLGSETAYDASYPEKRAHHDTHVGHNKVATLTHWLRVNGIDVRGLTVCEVGFGGGQCLLHLRDAAERVFGIEAVPEDLEHAVSLGLDPDDLFLNDRLPPRLPAPVDLWLFLDSFEHLERPDEFLTWLTENASERARVLLVAPQAGSPSERLFGRLWPHKLPDHRFHWSKRGLAGFFERRDFQVERLFHPKKHLSLKTLIAHWALKLWPGHSWLGRLGTSRIGLSLKFNIGEMGILFRRGPCALPADPTGMSYEAKQKLDRRLGSVLLFLLRLPVVWLGRILGRDHSLAARGDILIIKMQGGGSLVLAYTALLGIRERYPDRKLLLLTTPDVAPFGETLGLFDEILRVRDGGLLPLFTSVLRVWWRCLRIDTVVDLEVYSQLTTVFSALTAARNRVGFYLASTFWRRGFHTRLVFFNRFSPVHHFYEELARAVDAQPASLAACAESLRQRLKPVGRRTDQRQIAVGHACSELGRERLLSPEQWLHVFRSRDITSEEVIFLGGEADRPLAEHIIDAVAPEFPAASFHNLCGELPLSESISQLSASDEYWGVDSALVHYAQLLGTKTVSFWGPTDPRTLLRASADTEHEVFYNKVPCSPCIHVAETPPCGGKNICIASLFAEGRACESVETRPVVR